MSNFEDLNKKLEIVETPDSQDTQEKPSTSAMSGERPKRAGRRPGRRSSKMDVRAKLERSRQSARECRARKKMRYQYLEDLVVNREKAVYALREELELCKQWCNDVDKGQLPIGLLKLAIEEEKKQRRLKEPTYIDISDEEEKICDADEEASGNEGDKRQKIQVLNAGASGSSVDVNIEPGSRNSEKNTKKESEYIEKRTVSNKAQSEGAEIEVVDVEGDVDELVIGLSESVIQNSESRSGQGSLLPLVGSKLNREGGDSEKGSAQSVGYMLKGEKLEATRKSESQRQGDYSCLPTILEEFED